MRLNKPPSQCPFLDRGDERCSDCFRLEHLKHAFKFCFGRYKACPTYLQLQVERRIRGIESGARESSRDGIESPIQVRSPKVRSPLSTRINQPRLRELLIHLAAERGLAENSLHAYRRDLENLCDFLGERNRTLINAEVNDYREYLHAQSRGGKSTRTVARRLAAIRVMLRFSPENQKRKSAKILEQLDRPKPEQSLPKS